MELRRQLILWILWSTRFQLAACLPAGISNSLSSSSNETLDALFSSVATSESLSARDPLRLLPRTDSPDVDTDPGGSCGCEGPVETPLQIATEKGRRLLCQCGDPIASVAQSRVTDVRYLKTTGWRQERGPVPDFLQLADAFTFYHLVKTPAFQVVQWAHSAESKIGNTVYPATEAYYINAFDPEGGYIIAIDNVSPISIFREHRTPKVPLVKQWSDVAFIQWQTRAVAKNADIKNIKYIFQLSISNAQTVSIIEEVLGDVGSFPGKIVSMNDAAGKAILGTPNGAGVAYFLSSHKEKLGLRTIQNVRVWQYPNDAIPWMAVFEIGPVEQT